jgi:hypothetical protein
MSIIIIEVLNEITRELYEIHHSYLILDKNNIKKYYIKKSLNYTVNKNVNNF